MKKKAYYVREHIMDGGVIYTDDWIDTVENMEEAIESWMTAVENGDYHTGGDLDADMEVEAYFELLDSETEEVVETSNIVEAVADISAMLDKETA